MTASPEDEVKRRGLDVLGLRSFPDIPLRELSRMALMEAAEGRLRPIIGQTFPLERAAEAHAAIEGRMTVGKTLLIPG
jgi:NADPH2:quinone reductase